MGSTGLSLFVQHLLDSVNLPFVGFFCTELGSFVFDTSMLGRVTNRDP